MVAITLGFNETVYARKENRVRSERPGWNLSNHDGEKGNQPVKETGKQKPVVRGKPRERLVLRKMCLLLFYFISFIFERCVF